MLIEWLGPVLASGEARSLQTADALWLDQSDTADAESEEEVELIEEKEHLQEVLLEGEEE